jgi:hypothetical protein
MAPPSPGLSAPTSSEPRANPSTSANPFNVSVAFVSNLKIEEAPPPESVTAYPLASSVVANPKLTGSGTTIVPDPEN